MQLHAEALMKQRLPQHRHCRASWALTHLSKVREVIVWVCDLKGALHDTPS